MGGPISKAKYIGKANTGELDNLVSEYARKSVANMALWWTLKDGNFFLRMVSWQDSTLGPW